MESLMSKFNQIEVREGHKETLSLAFLKYLDILLVLVNRANRLSQEFPLAYSISDSALGPGQLHSNGFLP